MNFPNLIQQVDMSIIFSKKNGRYVMKLFLKKALVIFTSSALLFTTLSTWAWAEDSPIVQPEGETTSTVLEADVNAIAITKIENYDNMGVSLSWDSVEGAVKYLVEITKDGVFENALESALPNIDISDMTEGVQYIFSVKALDEAGAVIADGSSECTLVKPVTPVMEKVENFRYVRGYSSVQLKWSKVPGATGYRIYCRLVKGAASDKVMPRTPKATVKGTSYKMSMYPERKYNFWIVAYGTVDGQAVESEPILMKNVQKAHPLYYSLKLKKKVTIKCSCSGHKNVSRTFQKGETVLAYWFNEGVYKVSIASHTYKLKALYVSGGQCKPESKNPLSKEEIEYFVKEVKKKHKTKYIIVATLYTQHGYLMKKDSKGVYKMVREFPLSSGKAATPTPRGTNLKVWQRLTTWHGRPKWLCFYSINAFHGLKSGEKIRGNTNSHGCIRVNNSDRDYLWKTVPLNSGVIIY